MAMVIAVYICGHVPSMVATATCILNSRKKNVQSWFFTSYFHHVSFMCSFHLSQKSGIIDDTPVSNTSEHFCLLFFFIMILHTQNLAA